MRPVPVVLNRAGVWNQLPGWVEVSLQGNSPASNTNKSRKNGKWVLPSAYVPPVPPISKSKPTKGSRK